MCRICGVTPDDREVHAAWHASLPVTPATRAHERRVRAEEMRRGAAQ